MPVPSKTPMTLPDSAARRIADSQSTRPSTLQRNSGRSNCFPSTIQQALMDSRIKGRGFTIPHLLNIPDTSEKASAFDGASLAVFRLAPADYHRFHSPIDGTVGDVEHIPGQYYTGQLSFSSSSMINSSPRKVELLIPFYPVNPQAVNEPGFDVFTANTRSVLYLTHKGTGLPVAFVAIGALLVGSIKWTGGAEKGNAIKRGEELG